MDGGSRLEVLALTILHLLYLIYLTPGSGAFRKRSIWAFHITQWHRFSRDTEALPDGGAARPSGSEGIDDCTVGTVRGVGVFDTHSATSSGARLLSIGDMMTMGRQDLPTNDTRTGRSCVWGGNGIRQECQGIVSE